MAVCGLWPRSGNCWSLCVWVLLLLMVCARLGLSVDECMSACNIVGDEWSSELRVDITMAREVTLAWNADSRLQTTSYVVQFKERLNVQTFNTSPPISNTRYTIDSLIPNTNYEGRVCRANGSTSETDNCGNCLFCFSTIEAQEPPTSPKNLQVTAQGPQTITVLWEVPEDTNGGISNYTVECVRLNTGTLDFNRTGERRTSITVFDLLPNTTYTCSVVALNPFGESQPATDQITTPARDTIPGLLLTVLPDRIEYAQLTEDSIKQSSLLDGQPLQINTSADPVTGIDYHFYRGEIYTTTSGRKFNRMEVSLESNGVELELQVLSGFTSLFMRPDGVSLGSVAVDWVNNEVYFVERQVGSSTSRIMRVVIGNEGVPYCVGEFSSNPVGHIEVDPLHGYFYWNQDDSGLFRVVLSEVQVDTPSCLAPSSIPGATHIINDPLLEAFTIESSLYYIGSSDCFMNRNTALISRSLNAERTIPIAETPGQILASFSEVVLVASNDTPQVGVFNTSITARCPESGGNLIGVPSAPANVQILRAYRSVEQPLPVPPSYPTQVRVQTTSSNATITWSSPQFSVTSLFSPSAFDSWTYFINYTELGSSTSLQSMNTSSLSLTLTPLQPGSLYEFTISALGPGGEVANPRMFVFTTKMEGGDDALLLLATEVGVVRSTIGGGSAEVIAPAESDDANGVTYDSSSGLYYWVIEGGQSSVYSHSPSIPSGTTSSIHQRRDDPRSLKLDWLARRLLWVEDGETLSSPLRIIRGSLETNGETEVFAEVQTITTTALDSINGLFFWASGNTIFMKTLNGLVEQACLTVSRSPTALTVDVSQQLLYWASLSNEMVVTVSQVEYSRSGCGSSPETHTVPDIPLSSSPTVLAYFSGTLFISTLSSNQTFTIPANLSAITQQQTLAVGTVLLNSLSPVPQSIRDIAVIASELQPLPDGLVSPPMPSAFIPDPVGSPPRLGSGSNVTRIVVEWDSAPPLSFSSPIVYRLEYSLLRMDGVREPTQVIISEVPSAALNITMPYTEVNASVTSYSLWNTSGISKQAVFFSPPAVPVQVQNVTVFVYFPMLSRNDVSALVTWKPLSASEGGGFVQNYTVQVFQNGQLLPNLFQNPDNRTTYTVQTRSVLNVLDYPLQQSMSYVVNVFATNPTGHGIASQNVTFNTNMVTPPPQVVAVGGTGGRVVGEGVVPSLPPITEPLAVDTTGRQLFWYDRNRMVILRRSLDGGDTQPLIVPVSGVDVRALAYDWLGRTLYFAGRVERGGDGMVGVWVPRTNGDGADEIFVGDSLREGEGLKLVMDPFRGYLYWTISNGSSNSLNELNLRNPSTSTTLTVPINQVGKRQATMSLSSLSLTPALALDPRTRRLWICDAISGDILSCNPANGSCDVEVSAAALTGSDNGLPASSLALDELRVYWTNETTNGVFAVAFTDRTTLIEISSSIDASNVVTLSPGQQPLPNQTCLAPSIIDAQLRPEPSLVSKTNTSITVNWTVPTLLSECSDVFSFPPLMYMVRIMLNMALLDGYPQPTPMNQFRAEGLSPYLEYELDVSALNEFTQLPFRTDTGFGRDAEIRTLEGVPDPPQNIKAREYGTRNINVRWDPPIIDPNFLADTLRGSVDNLTYYVRVGVQEIETNVTGVNLTSEDGLLPGTQYTIEVMVSNGVLNSSASGVLSTTWPLPPIPVATGFTNTSLAITVPLNETHEPLDTVSVEVCLYNSTTSSCDCTSPFTSTTQNVSTLPGNVSFPEIGGLEAYTLYCMRATATYVVVPGFPNDPERLTGRSGMMKTGVGVPDPPVIRLIEGNEILQWDPPNNRGSEITNYRITAMRVNAPSVDTLERNISPRENQINLMTDNFLTTFDVPYIIQLFADNSIGEGAGSNTIPFTRIPMTTTATPLALGVIIGIAVGVIVVCVLVIVFIFVCVWCLTGLRRKQVDLRSISYQYGPDYELSNLRDQRRHQQASNPHYTWSREDYVCTDEELELLNKFPRQNLKLETFIDRGEFGEVYQGTAIDILGPDAGPTPVAVKTLRKGSTIEEQRKFLSEAALMSNFNHENIVKVLGVCVDNDPVYIIMELMPAGDLLKFLRDAKREHGPALLTLAEQVNVSLDVAKGCRYLELQHFIHRDIAARNCLVSSKGADRVVKIGDFGLAKDLYSSDYYQVEGQRKLPVRWMAPEALLQGKFTIDADIWSFGVLLWEIMTLGNQPYPGRTNQEVLQYVTGGGRLERPDRCPGRLYHLMQNCWKRYSSERPHFQQIVTTLTNFLDHLNKRESVYYDSDSDEAPDFTRQGSGKAPSRTPSIRSGIMNLARSSSMKLRNSLRRHGSLHRRDEHSTHNHQFSVSSSENLIASEEGGSSFRERGPF